MNAKLEAALAMANNANGNSPNALNSDTNANCRSDTTAMHESIVCSFQGAYICSAGASSKHGPGYTITEDLLICRAFIAASKDSVIGVSQKGKALQCKMHTNYILLLEEQSKLDQLKYQRILSSAKEHYSEPKIYHT
jgi:hypothetical protein